DLVCNFFFPRKRRHTRWPRDWSSDVCPPDLYARENYTRHDFRIPMRDGKRLYTIVYAPKDRSQKYPLLIRRTPYSVSPYGKGQRSEERRVGKEGRSEVCLDR